jgi:hypothetical protein
VPQCHSEAQPKNLDFATPENARCFALLSMTSMRFRGLRHSL